MSYLVAAKGRNGLKMRSMRCFDTLVQALVHYNALPERPKRWSRIWEITHDSVRILTKKEYQ